MNTVKLNIYNKEKKPQFYGNQQKTQHYGREDSKYQSIKSLAGVQVNLRLFDGRRQFEEG